MLLPAGQAGWKSAGAFIVLKAYSVTRGPKNSHQQSIVQEDEEKFKAAVTNTQEVSGTPLTSAPLTSERQMEAMGKVFRSDINHFGIFSCYRKPPLSP